MIGEKERASREKDQEIEMWPSLGDGRDRPQ